MGNTHLAAFNSSSAPPTIQNIVKPRRASSDSSRCPATATVCGATDTVAWRLGVMQSAIMDIFILGCTVVTLRVTHGPSRRA